MNNPVLPSVSSEAAENQSMATQIEHSGEGDNETSPSAQIDCTYNPKKPKWWKNLSGKATKGQKRAMEFVLSAHRLPIVPYGQFIKWDEIFPEGHDIWFELGFGCGENLLALAHRHRDEKV